MPHTINDILPALASLGLWTYWAIGAAALLESWFVTGVFLPGTLVVDAGGILVQQGTLHFVLLAVFVAVGSAIGNEVGFWTGKLARRGMRPDGRIANSRHYLRAAALFARFGSLALVLGRFLGPASGLVPLSAAVAGMDRRRFVLWNIIGSVIFALAHISLGFFLGDLFTRFGPLVTRLMLLGLAIVLGLALLWWIILRFLAFLPLAFSIVKVAAKAAIDTPEMQVWISRHPGPTRFIARRLRTGAFSGLPATFLALVFAYILTVWVETVFDFLTASGLQDMDLRIAGLMHAFWTPPMLRLGAHITALGGIRVILPCLVLALGWLILRGRRDLAAGLAVSVAGNVLSVVALKAVFDRPRPELAYFVESGNSFPSGHAAISVAFWAMLMFVLWRLRKVGPATGALLAATIAVSVGFSRVYLIEHYMTDVMNGWLVGAMWLVVGIAVSEWQREAGAVRRPVALDTAMRVSVIALSVVLLGAAGWSVARYQKALNMPVAAAPEIAVKDVTEMLADPGFRVNTESVLGNPLEPVNVVFLAPDLATLTDAMDKAGWLRARRPSFRPLARAAYAAYTNQADPTAPVTPYFWGDRPNDAAFEEPTSDATLRVRHHVRVWESRYVLPDGQRIFVGAASFDDGLDPGIFHHIDPNIDAERDKLADDLTKAGAQQQGMVDVSQPRLGSSIAGDPWFTNGQAVILSIP